MTTGTINKYFENKGTKGVKKKSMNTGVLPEYKKSRANGSTPPKDIPHPQRNQEEVDSITTNQGSTRASSENDTEEERVYTHERPAGGDLDKEVELEESAPAGASTEENQISIGKEDRGTQLTAGNNREGPMPQTVDNSTPEISVSEKGHKDTSQKDIRDQSRSNNDQEWKYVTRRIIISLEIEEPTDAQNRVELLCSSLNSFLDMARKFSGKHLRVMSFASKDMAKAENRKQWLKKFKACSMELKEFTNGYYPYQKLREGVYRLRVKLAIPLKPDKTITQFIEACSENWGNISYPTVRDFPSQHIYNPKKLGWFLRSTRQAAHTTDLQEELDNIALTLHPGLHFGLSYQTVPDPNNNGRWNPDTAVKAICIDTNEDTFHEAWGFLQSKYNRSVHSYPLGIKMNFVGTKDHPDYKNDFTAKQNIGILMKRQQIFAENMSSVSTHVLNDIDLSYEGTRTLRHRLMELSPKTLGPHYATAKLFHSIDRSISRSGSQSYHFTFHNSVIREASNIVSSICEMIRDELNINPEIYCFASHIREDYTWDPETRISSNPSVEVLNFVLGDSEDLVTSDTLEGQENEEEEFDLSSKAARERDRILGMDETETVEDIKKKKSYKSRSQIRPTETIMVQDDEVSEVTQYSNSTKASHERKKLRNEVEEQNKKIAELEARLASNEIGSGDSEESGSEASQKSGERSSEEHSLESEEGGQNMTVEEDTDEDLDLDIDDQEKKPRSDDIDSSSEEGSPATGVRFKESKNKVKYIPHTPTQKQSHFFSSSDESEESSPDEKSQTSITRKRNPRDNPPEKSSPKRSSYISKAMINKAKDSMRATEATRGDPGRED